MNKEILKGHLPILVLALLAELPRHGYAICKELQDRSTGALRLGEGTLYPLLYRLERQGQIRGKWETGRSGKPRKVYHVTPSGRRQIRAHQSDLTVLVGLFADVLGKEWVQT